MKILFTATEPKWEAPIDPRFGRAAYLVIYDDETQSFNAFDNQAISAEAHGAGTATSKKVYDLKPDVLITGNGPGESASKILKQMNIAIYVDAGDMTLRQSYEAFCNGTLKAL